MYAADEEAFQRECKAQELINRSSMTRDDFDEDWYPIQAREMYGGRKDPVTLGGGFEVKDSGVKAQHADGMQRDTTEGKPRFDLLIPLGMPYEETLLYRAAMHYMLGGIKYGDRNWEKSRSAESLEHHNAALWRHFMKFASGTDDGEDHAAAILWNLNAVIYTRWRLAQEKPVSPVGDDDNNVHEIDVTPDENGNSSFTIPDGAKHTVVNVNSRPLQPYTFPLPHEVHGGDKSCWCEGQPKNHGALCQSRVTGNNESHCNCYVPAEDDELPGPGETLYEWDANITALANPSDAEVALARSIIAARQAHYDREAGETLHKSVFKGLDDGA